MIKVEQFVNKNQFRLYGEGKNCLQSYNSLVVEVNYVGTMTITLGRDWDYSNTTSKHVYLFLEEYGNINFYGIRNKRDYVRKLIENGTIKHDWSMK